MFPEKEIHCMSFLILLFDKILSDQKQQEIRKPPESVFGLTFLHTP